MKEDIKKIIASGVMAPSGENCQPWDFVVTDNVIKLFNLPERDQSLYSWGQRASFMANGAAIENIVIAAAQFGYTTNVYLFPDKNNDNLIADIKLFKNNPPKDTLYEFIYKRCTNRKKYDIYNIDSDKIQELEKSVADNGVQIIFTQDSKKKAILGKAGSTNESIMLSNKHLHQYFFSHVNWSKEEDDEKKIGFFIDTLELPVPAKIGFKIIRYWPIANILNKIGFNKIVAKQNSAINAASSGFGIIVIKENSKESFIQAGRALERVWLTATKLDLSIQPLTGVLFFMYRVMANDAQKFSISQIESIKKAYLDIQNSFEVDPNKIIAFMFRIGRGERPSARSVRFSVDEVTQEI